MPKLVLKIATSHIPNLVPKTATSRMPKLVSKKMSVTLAWTLSRYTWTALSTMA